eukprot:CAMPEP_0202883832 /NCGR_PEP_ID=MMETSP1391-20130828/40050_1 /ASSEMBLY_ACC=CAM_ASM_000867 /TAXON_ID=1034604 /ORGANISM="Chlamydomonas leiostraca, Strain SAG 11-49" /LENGTH=40 /DNA_ID= /DNA_START= /DNA_END= /DNA_ORIENTATION=
MTRSLALSSGPMLWCACLKPMSASCGSSAAPAWNPGSRMW